MYRDQVVKMVPPSGVGGYSDTLLFFLPPLSAPFFSHLIEATPVGLEALGPPLVALASAIRFLGGLPVRTGTWIYA